MMYHKKDHFELFQGKYAIFRVIIDGFMVILTNHMKSERAENWSRYEFSEAKRGNEIAVIPLRR